MQFIVQVYGFLCWLRCGGGEVIFKQSDQVLGIKQPLKTQTRRLNFPHGLTVQLWKYGWSYRRPVGIPWQYWLENVPITDEHIAEANHILSKHIITLAVQPGRGKNAVGRIRITKIRRGRLGDISDEDCLAEGIIPAVSSGLHGLRCPLCPTVISLTSQDAYACLWEHIYGKGAWDRMKNDDVWVLEFECLKSQSPPSA